jgi:hypothetical protein
MEPRQLILVLGKFAICRLEANSPYPDWAKGDFVSLTRNPDELTIVCREQFVPDGIECEKDWRCMRVAGTLDFSMVGVIASISATLATADVSTFVISTFGTDYVLVKSRDLDRAIQTLGAAGILVAQS